MTALQVLKKARALIVKHGWRQRTYGTEHFGFCAVGAAHHVAGGPFANGGRVAVKALRRSIPCSFSSVLEWNDAEGRTKRQVLALFSKAIAKERKRRAKR